MIFILVWIVTIQCIFITTGKLKTVTNPERASYKKYAHWTLGQEIYTPSTATPSM